MKNALVTSAQDTVSEQEDAVFEERQQMVEEAGKQMEEESIQLSEDQMAALQQMLSDFGNDLLKEMEEAMEALENMEIPDPHMSPEELEKLKRKHRNAEAKAILKADLDYLKATIRHNMEHSNPLSNYGNSGVSPAGIPAAIPVTEVSAVPAIDVQV